MLAGACLVEKDKKKTSVRFYTRAQAVFSRFQKITDKNFRKNFANFYEKFDKLLRKI